MASTGEGEGDATGDGDDPAEQGAAGGAFVLQPVAQRDDNERGAGDDGEHDATGRGGQGPLVATDADNGAATGVGGNPEVGAPRRRGLGWRGGGGLGAEQGAGGKPDEGDGETAENALVGGGETVDGFSGECREGIAFAADDGAEALAAGGEDTIAGVTVSCLQPLASDAMLVKRLPPPGSSHSQMSAKAGPAASINNSVPSILRIANPMISGDL